MKIKRLEMVGFKSFVDRTVVNFDHDVMAIVGPNGCGKSNIVDAIRWCMGEQSARHLRGQKMEDVIFSGSESRSGHDFAEVTLTFENDAGDVPIEYRDYPEIAVTRRLHRSGDSDYLINKTPVRLKDVTDLFLGTGAGTKAYSIVEQGKIGLIVSAKPEDRRLLIEEAAGITKYKSRKKQAERKMELTQQNLLRVGDIVAEIERNLGSLKRQAAKAERYLAYRAELEDLSLYEASHRYLETVGWIKYETGCVDEHGRASEEVRVALLAEEAGLEELRQVAHVAEVELEGAQAAHFSAENDVRTEEAAIARATDRLGALRARAEQAGLEASELASQLQRLATEQAQVAAEVAVFEEAEAGQAGALAEKEARLAEVVREHDLAEKALRELVQGKAQAESRIASAEAKLAGFERRRVEMRQRHEKLAAEEEELHLLVSEHATRATHLEETAQDLREGKTASVEDQARAEADLARLRVELSTSDLAVDAAKAELSRKRSRMQALLEVQARLEGVGAGVKALLRKKDDTLGGLVADRVEAPHEYVAALAGLLGSRLQDVVVKDITRGAELLAELAATKAGRASIVAEHPVRVVGADVRLPEGPAASGVRARLIDVLRFAPDDEPLIRSLVGGALVVDDLAAAWNVRSALATPVPLVTADGTVVHADGRVSGGTGEELAAGMLEGKREARELGDEVRALDTRVTELLTRHQALRHSLVEAQSALDAARRKAHADELSLVSAEKDLRAVHAQQQNLLARAERVRAELEELRDVVSEADDEKARALEALEADRQRLADVSAELATAEANVATWRGALDEARAQLTERRVVIAGVRERLTSARGTVGRLGRSIQELEARAARLEEERTTNAASFGETAASLVLHRENRGAALDVARDRSESLAAARAVFEEHRAELSRREAGMKGLRAKVEEVRAVLAKHELALREQELILRHLLESVAEKFRGLHLPRVVGDYHLRPAPDQDTHARAQELTQLIERMGSVNLDAVREHEEAEKRYAFYTEQKADLDKALADLERAIAQMNRESKRLFAETFAAVNQKFQEIFPRMFRGGTASLRLTNPDDMLETGIDILAQPPGKKLSSIELMSGGEKALTAVSLIFAIFQIKPSPFCILDEVDAPLDEANVARYNETIRTMTHASQFILITHIKRTMQLADVLYGVTMQERGVSRLVSVKLNAAEERKPKPQPTEHVAVA
jgi:chromosome segregation protein